MFSVNRRLLDEQFDRQARKYSSGVCFVRPQYLNICLRKDTDLTELVEVSFNPPASYRAFIFIRFFILKKIKECFNVGDEAPFRFGIIGLHPCGDLASILINFFMQCPEAAFLNLVGCCYMKVSCAKRNKLHEKKATESDFIGYPLSNYLRSECAFDTHLSYEAREIACHAIERYTQRLSSRNYEYLRVHSFRAAIEKIICKNWPSMKHAGLRSIKTLTTFKDYCQQAVKHLDIKIPGPEVDSDEVIANLESWKNVVIFYSLRLMLAPLVESVILYDRLLWLMENGK